MVKKESSSAAKKGRGRVANNRPRTAPKAIETSTTNPESLRVQQAILDVFRSACTSSLQPEELEKTLQEVKGHLYNRDFAAAFGKDEYLQAYAARWSPSRALCYAHILEELWPHLDIREDELPLRVVCLGGGAGAELVAIAAWLSTTPRKIDVGLVDVANWTHMVTLLSHHVQTPPTISPYASEAVKAANKALVTGMPKVGFQQLDALELDLTQVRAICHGECLVTLMFTLNELYATSIPKTQRLLSHLTATLKPGSMLLVVDSPGSYSTVKIDGADRQYPMHALLDYTLLRVPAQPKWEKVMADESRWFRLDSRLQYPVVKLEDMRYQIQMYRRTGE